MVPKIHAKGRSFKGAANYLLHDIEADTAERVAWTEVLNIATRRAEAAWRVMAATSLDQDRLKRQAGIPNTGRKSKEHVLHFSLSWHASEAPTLTREEMMRAALTVLRVMKAHEHQAIVICHTDKPQPHVHVLVNRVNQRDGRILSSSFEKLKASRWAQKYEEERGQVFCTERVLNNAARDRGEFNRAAKDLPRHVHDAMKAAHNDAQRQRLLEEHRRWARALKERQRQLVAGRDAALKRLEAGYHNQASSIRADARQQAIRQVESIRTKYRPLWRSLLENHRVELERFTEREAHLLGRVQNALSSISFATLLGKRPPGDHGRAQTLSETFQVLSQTGLRLELLKRGHRSAKVLLRRQQKQEEAAAVGDLRHQCRRGLKTARETYLLGRNDQLFESAMENAKLKAEWREKGRKLRAQWEDKQSAPKVEDRFRGPDPDMAASVQNVDSATVGTLHERVERIRASLARNLKNARRAGRRR
jgi:hypothetical protein